MQIIDENFKTEENDSWERIVFAVVLDLHSICVVRAFAENLILKKDN